MRGFEKYIAFFLFAFISFWASANTNTDDLVKHAVAQLNKLYTENTYNDTNGKHGDNWYIYILGGTVEELEFVKDETNKLFTPGYLNQLNELLRKVNQGSEVDVYVAFTDYTSELITPIFPPEYNTLTLHELYISQLLENSPDKEHAVQLFRNYKAFFNSTIKRIYDESVISNSEKGNIFMPFTNFENRTLIDNETITITNKVKSYKTYTLYNPRKKDFDSGKYKKRYGEISATYGKKDDEILIERVVRALNDYYYGEEIEYKECQELLAKEEYQKYLKQDKIWEDIIRNNPCILSHIQELHGDYVGDTEFSQELRRVVNSVLYGAMAIPAAAIIGEYALYELGRALIKEYGAKKVKEVSQAAITNIVLQAALKYYFDKNSYDEDIKVRWQKALLNINKVDFATEVFVAACDINMRGDLILTCLTSGLEYSKEEWYNISEYDFDFIACRNDVAVQMILGVTLKTGGAVFSKMYKLAKEDPKIFITGLRELIVDSGAEGRKAFNANIKELQEAFDINNRSLIGIKIDVEAHYAEDVEQLVGDRNFKDLTKDVISEIEYAVANSSTDVTKVGTNVELNFPGYSGNIRPTVLTELSDGSYKMVFVVNKNTPINSVDDFINNADITGNRKEVLSAFQPNTKATLKGNNAEKYFGKQDAEINIKDIEIYTIDAQGNPVRNEVGVKVTGSWIDDLDILLGGGAKTKVNNWIDEGLDALKVKEAFTNATNKADLFNKLDNAKSIQHQRVLINDLDKIPGAKSGKYVSNSVDNITQNIVKIIDGKQFTLKLYQVETFQKNANLINRTDIEIIEDLNNGIQLVKVKPGTKIYRVYDGYLQGVNTLPKGNYWTFEKPSSISEVIGGAAVQPEWNSMTKIIEIEVPSQGIYVWRGKAAKQPLSNNENISNYFLQGGTEQLIFDINQNAINITSITNSIVNLSW